MKRALLSVAVALVLVSCERQEPQDVVSYAVVSGKKVKSIEIWSVVDGAEPVRYTYEYDLSGKVSKVKEYIIDKNLILSDEYILSYSEDIVVAVEGEEYRWDYFYDEDGCLKEYTVSDIDKNLIKYSYGFVWREDKIYGCFVTDGGDDFLYHALFEWDGSNLEKMNNIVSLYGTILDNFSVVLPFGCYSMTKYEDVLFYDVLKSEYLPVEISSKSYSYERNTDGDICRINVGGDMYYLIEYYD